MDVRALLLNIQIYLCALLCLLSGSLAADLTFELPDNEKSCFFQDFTVGAKHIFQFAVIKGGKLDVDASLESPNGKILYKETKQKSGYFVFDSSVGTFKFCFGNEFSTFTHKVVYFEVRPELEDTLASEVGLDRPSVNTHMEDSMESIHLSTLNVMGYQTDYRLKEAMGRHRAEEVNMRVHFWSMGQAVIILLTGLSQVAILRAFFTDKRSPAAPPTVDVQYPTDSL